MIKFYFQYDKERHKAKVVLDGDPSHVETFYVDSLDCQVPVMSVLQKESPQFVMRGECRTIWHGHNSITLTNKR